MRKGFVVEVSAADRTGLQAIVANPDQIIAAARRGYRAINSLH